MWSFDWCRLTSEDTGEVNQCLHACFQLPWQIILRYQQMHITASAMSVHCISSFVLPPCLDDFGVRPPRHEKCEGCTSKRPPEFQGMPKIRTRATKTYQSRTKTIAQTTATINSWFVFLWIMLSRLRQLADLDFSKTNSAPPQILCQNCTTTPQKWTRDFAMDTKHSSGTAIWNMEGKENQQKTYKRTGRCIRTLKERASDCNLLLLV